MRLDNTYYVWPLAVILLAGVIWLAGPELSRGHALQQRVEEVASGIGRIARYMADAIGEVFHP